MMTQLRRAHTLSGNKKTNGKERCEDCGHGTYDTKSRVAYHTMQHYVVSFCYCGKAYKSQDSCVSHRKGCEIFKEVAYKEKNGKQRGVNTNFVDPCGFTEFVKWLRAEKNIVLKGKFPYRTLLQAGPSDRVLRWCQAHNLAPPTSFPRVEPDSCQRNSQDQKVRL